MNKFRLIKTMLMNAPVSLTMAVMAQVMSIILGHSSGLNIGEMALSFVVSYIFACLIGYFVPTDKWGMHFAIWTVATAQIATVCQRMLKLLHNCTHLTR